MRTVRTGWSKLLLSLALSAALLFGGVPPAQAHAMPAALTQPVAITPPAPVAPPAHQDFSDADFQQADQAELGHRTGGAGRITEQEWILIIGGVLLLLIILIIIF